MKKQFLSPTTKGKRLYLTCDLADNFSSTAKAVANCRNIALFGNKIVNAKGITSYGYSGTVKKILGSWQGQTFVLTSLGICKIVDKTYTNVITLSANDMAFCVHRGDVVFSGTAGTYVLSEFGEVCTSSQHWCSSIVSFGDRVWGVNGNKLYATDISKSIIWENGVYIELPTTCTHLAVWDNKLYAFGKQIYQIDVNSNDVDTVITSIGSYGTVLATSTSPHNGKLYFGTGSGLYVLNAKGARLILHWPSGVVDLQMEANSSSIFANLCYEGNVETNIVQYDIALDGIVSIRLTQVQDIAYVDSLWAVLNGALTTCSSDYSYSSVNLEIPLPYSGKTYYLRTLYLNSKHDMAVTLTTDKATYTSDVAGKVGIQCLPLCGKCKQLTIELIGRSKLDLSHLALEVVCYEI